MARSTAGPDDSRPTPARKTAKGHDVRSLGPSDSSDSGSDMTGIDDGADDNSDRDGTGERMTAGREERVRPGADVDVDRVVGADEAGLGTGLDEAEEALLDDDQRAAPPTRQR